MTQHTDLIALLRANADMMPTDSHIGRQYKAAADAMEATARNAFEAMPHDIPQRMKDAICEETGWSGSMVSRMYTELRKAFTGEPYRANEDLDAALLEVARLRKDAGRYRLLRECGVDSYEACGSGDKLDAECDAAIAKKGQP